MKLLLKRRHDAVSAFSLAPLRIGNGNIFYLHVSIEVDDEERHLMRKYGIDRASLSETNALDDLKDAFDASKYIGLLAALVVLVLFSWSNFYSVFDQIAVIIVSWIGITIAATIFYYLNTRESFVVNQLMDGGKNLRCNTVEDLVRKEIRMLRRCRFLQNVLVSARTWDDKEIIEIEPLDKDDAKLAVYKATRW